MSSWKGFPSTRLHNETIRAILNFIRENNLKKGDRLPSQEEFADRLNISRATLREALVRLASDGMIRQVHGVGTFVAEDPSVVYSDAEVNLSITESIRIQGMQPSISSVKLSTARIPFELDSETHEDVETDVLCIRRIHLADGSPFACTMAYLPLTLPGLVFDEDGYKGSLHLFLQEHCGQFVTEASTVIEAQIADGEIAQLLGLPPLSPILVLHQRQYNQAGKLLIKSHDYFCQNHFHLSVHRRRPIEE
jgi:GntR family transcriptional regulator